jgi:hypothetical protein
MGFEGLDGLFGHIATVIMVWNALVLNVVVWNCLLEIRGALVVEDVAFWGDSGAFQSVNELLICANHFSGGAIFHGLMEDAGT